MRFSVDQESVADIISSLTSYSDDIDAEFRKFQDEIKKIAIRTNYNKLLHALQGITDIYHDAVCGSMRKQLIAQWIDEGESLHAFAEDVYMGEESEEAARRIENSLEEIFISSHTNELLDLEFDGDSNATKMDFNDAVCCFESFEKEIEGIRERNRVYFESKTEENELYRFLVPLVESIAIGIAAFASSVKKELDQLGENYVEKMERAKQLVEEAKSKSNPMDFDLDLFDFDEDNSLGSSLTAKAAVPSAPSAAEIADNESKSKEHIKNIGRRMQQDFAPHRTDRKPIEDIIEYANGDNLENDILNFSSVECKLTGQVQSSYIRDMTKLNNEYKQKKTFLSHKYSKLLVDCYKTIEKDLSKARRDLERRFIKRTISALLGRDLFQESIDRANALYHAKKNALYQQYHIELAGIDNIYNRRRQDIETRKQDEFSYGVVSQCKNLYDMRKTYAQDIQNGVPDAIEKLKIIGNNILKVCTSPCRKLARIAQDVFLALNPNVVGFSYEPLGHRITINEKKKSWIDANLSASDAKNVSADGILHMKTPIHEYLHYLSNGGDGSSGVKNKGMLAKIQSRKERDDMFQALTGFNEGITEMFAQDYLQDEMAARKDFNNPNAVLKKENDFARQKSYSPQVDVIRSICKVLGSNAKVKEAYIRHDFSIIENEITRVLNAAGKSFDWDQAKKDMAEIQRCYSDKNPATIRQNIIQARNLSKKMIGMLEA